jgi:hypothetical protein
VAKLGVKHISSEVIKMWFFRIIIVVLLKMVGGESGFITIFDEN